MDWTSKDAAKVGVVETTIKITAYPHPRYPNLVYYDLPGVNTPKFPQATYLDAINVEMYDFFVLTSSNRFSEIDGWLAKELANRKKPFYFVQTKVDEDVRNNHDMMKKSKDETLNEIRHDCQQNLQKSTLGVQQTLKVFLVSSRNPMDFDFPEFQSKMIHDAPEGKRKALISTIASFSPIMINIKRKNLEGQIIRLTAQRALTFLPVKSREHKPFIQKTLENFKTQLGIDPKSTQAMKELCRVVLEEIQTDSCETSKLLARCEEDVKAFMTKSTIANILKYIPVVGTAVGCVADAFVWQSFFNKLLNLCVKEAELLHKAVAEALSDRENIPS